MADYFIKTERIGFRRWDLDLLPEAIALWGDSKVTEWIGGKMSENAIQSRLLSEIEFDKEYGLQYWPIFLLETDEFLGCCGLRPYKADENIYEIGVHIVSNHWRKGFAKEAVENVIDYAFHVKGIDRIFAGHNPQNKASEKLLRKMKFAYSHEEYYPPTGLRHPSYFLEKPED